MTNLALLQTPTAGQRRKVADKLAAFMPKDAAHEAATLLVSANDVVSTGPTGNNQRAFTVHESGLNCVAAQRVLLPLIDPNHLNFGRLITGTGKPSRPAITQDGILAVTWANPATQNQAIKSSVTEYLATHDLIPKISDLICFNGLDSWHSPLVLVPVRHQYADGTPTQLRWMAADGTARIVAYRNAINTLFPWLADHPVMNSAGEWTVSNHPYQDPYGNWNPNGSGVAMWRSFLSIARVYATAEAEAAASDPDNQNGAENRDHPEWFMQDERFTQDWGTLVLPGPDGTSTQVDLEAWLMRSHRQGDRPDLADD